MITPPSTPTKPTLPPPPTKTTERRLPKTQEEENRRAKLIRRSRQIYNNFAEITSQNTQMNKPKINLANLSLEEAQPVKKQKPLLSNLEKALNL